jgi:MFS family permease
VAKTRAVFVTQTAHHRSFRILFVGLVCIGMGQSILFSTLPPAARELGLTPFRISTIFATSATLWVFVSPWWGRRSDVVGRRPIILAGLLGYALSMALVATTVSAGRTGLLPLALVYPCLIGSRSIFALLGSGTGPASQAYVADRTTHAERTAGVAFLNAAMGLGETVGPGFGAMLAVFGLAAPLYFAAAVAVASAALLWRWLPEEAKPHASLTMLVPRLHWLDGRVLPFLAIAAALQAVRATTTITLSLFFQDTLGLDAATTVRDAGIGFVVLAVSGLFSQLVLVQRLRPTARAMLRTGVPLMLAAFAVLVVARGFAVYLAALVALGLGLGLVRPGTSAGASLSVGTDEQGAVAGVMGGLAVVGNVVGPMVATTLYQITPRAPYLLSVMVMGAALVVVLASPRVRALRA